MIYNKLDKEGVKIIKKWLEGNRKSWMEEKERLERKFINFH